MMEMRKFVVELHTDGSMTWAEYTEPCDAGKLMRIIKDCVVDRRKDVEAQAKECARRGDFETVEIKRACATEDRLIEMIVDRIRKDYGV